MSKNNELGLYIHIPFCDTICPYCAFSHTLSSINKQDEYLTCLINDINLNKDKKFSSIYIGGGTPSSLNYNQLDRLLSALDELISSNIAFTFEANPSSLTEDKIKLLSKHRVNRISLGIQTFDLNLQKKLNRIVTYEEILYLIDLIKKYDINDINVDLMFGIENENLDVLKHDLDLFTSLDITHISTYCLQIEEHTIFYNQKIKEMNQDDAADEYDFICKYLKEKGFIHYEVSNFSKPNFQSKHNLLYWRNKEYIGLGISAASYYHNKRYVNENSLSRYLKHIDKKEIEVLTKDDEELYYIILNLRLNTGINFKEFEELYHKDFLKTYAKEITKLLNYNYLEIKKDFLRVKEEYFFILNEILIEFM